MNIQETAKKINNNYKKEIKDKKLTTAERIDVLEAVIENLLERVNYLEGK